MDKVYIWIVWEKDLSAVDEADRQWDVYDFCLSEEAAEKAMAEGEKDYPWSKFFIERCVAHG